MAAQDTIRKLREQVAAQEAVVRLLAEEVVKARGGTAETISDLIAKALRAGSSQPQTADPELFKSIASSLRAAEKSRQRRAATKQPLDSTDSLSVTERIRKRRSGELVDAITDKHAKGNR